MTEKKVLVLDINAPTLPHGQKNSSGWSRSDNSFKFDFFAEGAPALPDPPANSQENDSGVQPGLVAFTGQGSGFAFNFQIPEGTQNETNIETVSASNSRAETKATSPSVTEIVATEAETKATSPSVTEAVPTSPPSAGTKPTKEEPPVQNEPPVSSKAKKKKKSEKHDKRKESEKHEKRKASAVTEVEQKKTASPKAGTEGAEKDDGTTLSADQQLRRELDWCIEKLEAGLNTQKTTPKQKEEACRAIKTLRSSKAPLAKKRQVMRSTAGDYRKKMEDEKNKQFKLIQAAMTSAHVNKVAEPAKKSVFHRRADCRAQVQNTTVNNQQGTAQTLTDGSSVKKSEGNSTFVFTPTKEEFSFNFF